jgi:predicted dehydrogenase
MAHGHPAALVDQLEILETKGAIRLNGDRLTLCYGDQTAQSITFDLQANYKASYAGAITHFLDCLASGAGFETDPADNLQTLEIIERAYSSS